MGKMKKNLPNIVLLILFAVFAGFLVFLYKGFGLGVFVKALGIVMFSAGVLAFLFFLSIDPGYGWSKTVNFNANYITISVSIAVSIVGLVLFLTGRTVHITTIQEQAEAARCRSMVEGNVGDVIDSEWYFLSDRKGDEKLSLYLFQKKGEIKNFKLIVINSSNDVEHKIRDIKVSSAMSEDSVILQARDGACSGIFEGNVMTHMPKTSAGKPITKFDVMVDYVNKGVTKRGKQKEFQLGYELENIYCF